MQFKLHGRGGHGSLMVSALDSGLRGPGSSPGWGHCVVFSSMTVKEYNGTLNCQGNLMKCRRGGGGGSATD